MQSLNELFQNKMLGVAIASWFAAQFIKIIIEFAKHKKFDLRLLMATGGMPSSHSAFVTSLAVCVGIQDDYNSAAFAISAIMAMIVMYDAQGVRRAAGKQAEVINMLVTSLENQGVKLDKKLKELLGHSPVEVGAGCVLGIVMAVLLYHK